MDIKTFCQQNVIALTGGIASGKSTIARYLTERGYEVCDADQLAREVVLPGQPALKKITERFGPTVLAGDGSLDRKALAAKIFPDEKARHELNSIMHPAIAMAFGQWLQDRKLLDTPPTKPLFYEAALILELGRGGDFKEIWLAYCGEDTQIQRLKQRDGLSEQAARTRLLSQWSFDQKKPLADVLLDTDQGVEQTKAAIDQQLRRF